MSKKGAKIKKRLVFNDDNEEALHKPEDNTVDALPETGDGYEAERELLGDNESDSGDNGQDQSDGPDRGKRLNNITVNLADGTQTTYDPCPVAIPRCFCSIKMRAGRCQQGENKGRLFFTCAKNDRTGRCNAFYWVTNPRLIKWLENYPKDAAYNAYAGIHASAPPKKNNARVIRANVY